LAIAAAFVMETAAILAAATSALAESLSMILPEGESPFVVGLKKEKLGEEQEGQMKGVW
jgi:predicted metal-dependent hydrolase